MKPNIKASDANWHVTSVSFDKQMAIPVNAPTDLPTNPENYIKVSVQITDDEGNLPPQYTNVYFGDDQTSGVISYWYADKTRYTGSTQNGFKRFLTDSKGVAAFYIAFNAGTWSDSVKELAQTPFVGRIVNVLASMAPNPDGMPSYNVLFCYYNQENGTYPALDASQVSVPPWSQSITPNNYFITQLRMTNSQSHGAAGSSPVVLILDDTPIFGFTYDRILTSEFGLNAPYYDMMNANGSSRILYFVQDSPTSPGILSYSTTFNLNSGNWIPQAMPNPSLSLGEGFVLPYWFGAKDDSNHIPRNTLGPTALSATHNGSYGFEVVIEYPATSGMIKPGDIINVYAYVSAYDEHGAQMTQVFGDGSLISANPHASSSDNVFQFKAYEDDLHSGPSFRWHSVLIPQAWLEVFGQQSNSATGYMWVNYKVTPADEDGGAPKWSGPYVGFSAALQINFAGY